MSTARRLGAGNEELTGVLTCVRSVVTWGARADGVVVYRPHLSDEGVEPFTRLGLISDRRPVRPLGDAATPVQYKGSDTGEPPPR